MYLLRLSLKPDSTFSCVDKRGGLYVGVEGGVWVCLVGPLTGIYI